jgi:hypothetical protein
MFLEFVDRAPAGGERSQPRCRKVLREKAGGNERAVDAEDEVVRRNGM